MWRMYTNVFRMGYAEQCSSFGKWQRKSQRDAGKGGILLNRYSLTASDGLFFAISLEISASG